MPKMTWKQLLQLIESQGWVLHHVGGSHRQFRHPEKAGTVTLSGHRETDMVPTGTLLNAMRQAGLR